MIIEAVTKEKEILRAIESKLIEINRVLDGGGDTPLNEERENPRCLKEDLKENLKLADICLTLVSVIEATIIGDDGRDTRPIKDGTERRF